MSKDVVTIEIEFNGSFTFDVDEYRDRYEEDVPQDVLETMIHPDAMNMMVDEMCKSPEDFIDMNFWKAKDE